MQSSRMQHEWSDTVSTCSTLTDNYIVMDTFISMTIIEWDLSVRDNHSTAKYVTRIIYSKLHN